MKKTTLLLLVVFLCIGVVGCATLKKLNSETTTEDIQAAKADIATAAQSVPAPWNSALLLIGAVGGGYVLALAKREYKDIKDKITTKPPAA